VLSTGVVDEVVGEGWGKVYFLQLAWGWEVVADPMAVAAGCRW
jgi:hypothetical protein